MQVINPELVQRTLETPGARCKFIMNENAISFFSSAQHHRDHKAGTLSYNDHEGNAVAGIIMQDKVEIRFHNRYSDARIRELWTAVRSSPEMADARIGKLYYQGREIR